MTNEYTEEMESKGLLKWSIKLVIWAVIVLMVFGLARFTKWTTIDDYANDLKSSQENIKTYCQFITKERIRMKTATNNLIKNNLQPMVDYDMTCALPSQSSTGASYK